MPVQSVIYAAVITVVIVGLLTFATIRIRRALNRAGARLDAILADLNDVPLGEEQITEAERRPS